jgi:hypothetical protein
MLWSTALCGWCRVLCAGWRPASGGSLLPPSHLCRQVRLLTRRPVFLAVMCGSEAVLAEHRSVGTPLASVVVLLSDHIKSGWQSVVSQRCQECAAAPGAGVCRNSFASQASLDGHVHTS